MCSIWQLNALIEIIELFFPKLLPEWFIKLFTKEGDWV